MSDSVGVVVKGWLDRMSVSDLIGQISQIDLGLLLDTLPDGTQAVNSTKIQYYIGDLGVGSVLNTVTGMYWNATQFRSLMMEIQNVAALSHRPPVIYGIDSVHGANYVHGATLMPQPINMAATFNTSMSFRAGLIASRDTRAAGIPWLFSPLLGVALDPRWSRVYETFGEDPWLVTQMALALTQGIQTPDFHTDFHTDDHNHNHNHDHAIPSRAAACAKHFIGYTMPLQGHDRAPSWIPTRHLYQYFVPPWRKVLQEVLTVMEDYTEYDGVPNVANQKSIDTMLRFQLGFQGMLVTDYSEIWNLADWHHVASSHADAVATALRHGIDMSMIPWDMEEYAQAIQSAIEHKQLSLDQIRTHAQRVLLLKQKLNMFQETISMDDPNIAKVGTDREEALEMAQQSLVLVKNDIIDETPVLPISPITSSLRVLITGPTAHSLSFQSGGWTWQWQGTNNNNNNDERDWFTYGTTVLEAAHDVLHWQVSYECGVDILGNDCNSTSDATSSSSSSGSTTSSTSNVVSSVENTVEAWMGLGTKSVQSIKMATQQDVDYIIVCVGEENYAEKPGDINDLNLPSGQITLVQELAANKNNAKLILVYFGGRPRLLKEMEPYADAIIIGFLPGPDAGKAMMNVITAATNPSGRLPMTYPKHPDLQGSPYFHSVSNMCTRGDGPMPHYEYTPCDVQWPFGHGLSYTTFEYTGLTISSNTIHYHAPGQAAAAAQSMFFTDRKNDDDVIYVSVKVTNTGVMAGLETVLFFTFDESRSVTPEYKRLRAFEKVMLLPGESKVVKAMIAMDDLRFIGPRDESHWIVQDGLVFTVGVGSTTDCRASDTNTTATDPDALCTEPITVVAGDDNTYVGACDAACRVWEKSVCSNMISSRECWSMCIAASEDGPGIEKEGWGWPYVSCIESISAQSDGTDCWKMSSHCRDIFATKQPIPNPTHMASIVGLIMLGLSSLMVVLSIRGDLFRCLAKIRRATVPMESVEFTPIDTDQEEAGELGID